MLKLRRKDFLPSLAFFLITLFVALLFVFWAPRIGRHDVLHSRMRRYNAHIASPLYSVSAGHPLVLDLKDEHRRELVEVKLVAACTELGCGGHEEEAHRRRLTARRGLAELDDHSGLQVLEDASWVQWAIYAGSVKCGYERLELRGTQQAETLSTLDLIKSPCADAVRRARPASVAWRACCWLAPCPGSSPPLRQLPPCRCAALRVARPLFR